MRRSPCHQFVSFISPSFAFSETDKRGTVREEDGRLLKLLSPPIPPQTGTLCGFKDAEILLLHSFEFMSLISLCDILICPLQLQEALSINQCQVTVWCNSTTQWSAETPISQNTHLLLLISASGKRLHVLQSSPLTCKRLLTSRGADAQCKSLVLHHVRSYGLRC